MKTIVTVPPCASYVGRAAAFESVRGVRWNTVMPIPGDPRAVMARLRSEIGDRELWIDLKCRQLRVAASSYVPYHHVELTHEIEVRTPVLALFNSGEAIATVCRVEGNRLFLEDTPPIPLGAGMSVNILDPTVVVKGYLTERDRDFIAAARDCGEHAFLLSYVERSLDIEDLLAIDPEAVILAKIESLKGLHWVQQEYSEYAGRVHLVAARGDLFVELGSTARILDALRTIIHQDEGAVAASRILSSLRRGGRPTCEEMTDVAHLAHLGYRTLLLGDELSFQEGTLLHAMSELERIFPYV